MNQQQQTITSYSSDCCVLPDCLHSFEKSPPSWCFWGETSSMRWIWLYSVCRSFKSNLPSFGSRISYMTYSALYRCVWKNRKFAGNILRCYLCLYLNLCFPRKKCNAELAVWKVCCACFKGLSKIQRLKLRISYCMWIQMQSILIIIIHREKTPTVVESELAKYDLMSTMNSTLTSLSTCVSSE